MAPSVTERDELFRGFARALFKGDDGKLATRDDYRKPVAG
jgi:hypothetical protein